VGIQKKLFLISAFTKKSISKHIIRTNIQLKIYLLAKHNNNSNHKSEQSYSTTKIATAPYLGWPFSCRTQSVLLSTHNNVSECPFNNSLKLLSHLDYLNNVWLILVG